MCGIVGVAGTGPMSVQMKEFFATLLLHDVIRGHHATGVAAIDTLNRDLCVEKKAMASPEFLQEKEAMDNLFAHKHNFNIYIGHNRWATSGNKDDDDGAHPFIHGDIVGVHNGSLRNQSLLDDHKDFKVDSDNLFYHMSKHGLDETIKKTNGAFALVWYDRSDNSLNFVRNDERPLAIGKLSNGSWVWASEIGMLRWLVKRHKQLAFETITEKVEGGEIKRETLFNLEKDTHLKISFKDKTRQYDGDPVFTKKVMPDFPYETVYTGRTYGTRGWNDTRTSTTTSHGSRQSHAVGSYNHTCQGFLDKFIRGAKMSDSILQVAFKKIVREKTTTGYEATIAIFEFMNKDGLKVICHAFVHNGVKFLMDWEGDDTKVGEKVFGTICTVSALSMATYDCTKNPEPLGFALSLNLLSLSTPKSYYPYGQAPGPKVDKPKGGADAGKNVVPFQGPKTRTLRPSHEETAKEVGSTDCAGSSASEVEGIDDGSQVILANGITTKGKLVAIYAENGPSCSNCGERIDKIPVNRLYRTMWFDRSEGVTQNYLSCSKRCFNMTEAVMDQLDEDYDKLYGGRDA